MNDLQFNAMKHLTTGGEERKRALGNLINRGVLLSDHNEERTRRDLEAYLTQNPLKFCNEGIQRFRDAVGLKVAGPSIDKVTLTLELEFERLSQNLSKLDGGEGASNYNYSTTGMTQRLANALNDFTDEHGNKLVKVTADYQGLTEANGASHGSHKA